MSNTDIRVVPGPANYYSHRGVLARLDAFFTPEQLSRAVWIYGERAIAGAQPFLPQSFHKEGAKHLLFKGHCSEHDVSQLVNASGTDRSVVIGVGGALAIRDVLLEHSEQALADQTRREVTREFHDVVDAIIAGGGMVGGLGERYTRVAAAHAVHNGLTVLPQTAAFLHGTKVAYGILVQSALLGQDEVLRELVAAYQRFNLPTTLRELDVDIHNRDELDKVIAHTLRPVESIHALPIALTPAVLHAAFEKVENFSHPAD